MLDEERNHAHDGEILKEALNMMSHCILD